MNDDGKPDLARLEARLGALPAPHGYRRLAAADLADFCAAPGTGLVFFAEDPLKVPETWDLAVILADALKAVGEPLRVGLLPAGEGRALAGRYGVALWPALVGLRDGGYLGALEGIMDWPVFSRRLAELLAAPVSRPPGIGIPVQVQGSCH